MTAIKGWKAQVEKIKIETYTLYLAYKKPTVPWYAKVFAACIVAYVFSPIDLIPDFIPVLGYLDELIILPLGLTLALKMIPKPVLEECREDAQRIMAQRKPTNWAAAGVIIIIWLCLFLLIIVLVIKVIRKLDLLNQVKIKQLL